MGIIITICIFTTVSGERDPCLNSGYLDHDNSLRCQLLLIPSSIAFLFLHFASITVHLHVWDTRVRSNFPYYFN